MAKFNHMSALQHLIKIDTNIFKEELYYPWYTESKNIQIVTAAWLFSLSTIMALLITLTTIHWMIPVVSGLVLTIILAGGYFILISQSKNTARKESLKQIMALEKNQFMKNIEPFVAVEQQNLVKRISTQVDFSPHEYASLVVTTKSRVILNTEAFIKDLENMFADKKLESFTVKDDDYCDTVFKVPEAAKKYYEKVKNRSTFNDDLQISPQAQAAILAKVREATNRKALGREA